PASPFPRGERAMPPSKKKRPRDRRREDLYQASWEELGACSGHHLHGQVRWWLYRAGLQLEPDQVEDRVQEVYCRLLLGGTLLLRQFQRWSELQVVRYLGRTARRVVCDAQRAARAVKRGAGFEIALAG